MSIQKAVLVFFLTCSGLGQTLFAGEVLRLESGNFDIQNLPRTLDLVFNNKLQRHYHIVQFKEALLPSQRQQLEQQNIQFLSYIPDDAYVLRLSSEQARKLSQNELVRALTPYRGQLSLSQKLVLRNVFDQDRVQSAEVHVFRGEDMSLILATADQLGIRVESVSGHVARIVGLASAVNALADVDGVEWVTAPRRMQIHTVPLVEQYIREKLSEEGSGSPSFAGDYSDLTGLESGTRIMNFHKTWERGYSGKNQIIAASDTGLDLGTLDALTADFANFYKGFVWGEGEKTWVDVIGHGTHVLGSVGGRGTVSGEWIQGGAFSARLVMQALWSKKQQTLMVPDDLGDLFAQAYATGARIHTNSWGDPFALGVYDKSSQQVDKFMWDNPDMLVLFAAGNSGVDMDRDGRIDPGSVSSPATAKNILSVGASENEVSRGGIQEMLGRLGGPANGSPWSTEPLASDRFSNNRNGIAAFSSRGPTLDGRTKPDIVAPGTNILSNCSRHPMASPMWGKYNEEYCFSGGTSMSAPLVAGAAAIVRERLIEKIKNPSAALVKAVLMHTAVDLYPGQFGEIGLENGQELLTPGPNSDQGYGRADVARAVGMGMSIVDDKVGLATGESRFYDIANGVRKVTLVYTDYPAAPNAATALVNDLDIEVHVGQKIFKSSSRVNNTEQVELDIKAEGPVRIYVRAKNVPFGRNGKQPFALAVSATK